MVAGGVEFELKGQEEVEENMKRQENYWSDSIVTILIVVMVSQTHTYIKIIHFKYVLFIVCQVYFNKTLVLFF